MTLRRPDLAARNRGAGGVYEDPDWCRTKYDSGMTLREIAAEAGCSLRTIARWMPLHGIDVQPGHIRREMRGTTARGERSGQWTGGAKPCIDCGGRKDRGSQSRCAACHYAQLTGEANPNWRGDRIRNPQAHGRVKKLRGLACDYMCRHCGAPAKHWAYDHEDPKEKQDPEGPYSLDPEHYLPLCVACHHRFDWEYRRSVRASA